MKPLPFITAFACLAASLFLLQGGIYGWVASYVWFGAMTLYVLAWKRPSLSVHHIKSSILVLFLLVTGVFLLVRFVFLASVPFFVNGDEAHIGLGARMILDGTVPNLFVPGWYDYPQLTFFLPALSMAVRDDLIGLRLSSVSMAVLSLAGTAYLAYAFFGKRTACIAGLLLAASHYHLHFSRSGISYMQGAAFTSIALALFVAGIRRRNSFLFALSGIITGLGFHVYLSARITIMLLAAYTGILYLFYPSRIRPTLFQMIVFTIGGLFALAPVLLIWHRYPSAFSSRTRDVLIFSNPERMRLEYNTIDWVTIIQKQTVGMVDFFTQGGDRSSQYGYKGPAADRLTRTLLLFGLLRCCWSGMVLLYRRLAAWTTTHAAETPCRYGGQLFLPFWFLITLAVGGILTIDLPFSPRLLPAILPLSIMAAWGLDGILQRIHSRGAVRLLTVVCLLGIMVLNVKMYFVDFHQQDIDYNSYRYTYLARALRPRAGTTHFVLITDPGFFLLDHGTIHFLAPEVQGPTVPALTPEIIQSAQSVSTTFIIPAEELSAYQNVRAVFPQAKEEVIMGRKNQPLFRLLISSGTEEYDAVR